MLKKAGIINAPLLFGLAELGHRDVAIVTDAGFPIPSQLRRIDVALIPGVPSMMQTLEAVVAEADIEEAIVSREMADANPRMLQGMRELLMRTEGIELRLIPHEDFKKASQYAKFALRTGEVTPYSNIMLIAGAKTHIETKR
jgi:D-ribose pyranase